MTRCDVSVTASLTLQACLPQRLPPALSWFHTFVQSQLSISRGSVSGFSALLRWSVPVLCGSTRDLGVLTAATPQDPPGRRPSLALPAVPEPRPFHIKFRISSSRCRDPTHRSLWGVLPPVLKSPDMGVSWAPEFQGTGTHLGQSLAKRQFWEPLLSSSKTVQLLEGLRPPARHLIRGV